MDEVLKTAANQAPSLVVLCVVVLLFLRAQNSLTEKFSAELREQRKDWMAALKLRDEQAANIAIDCHACQIKCADSLKENTRMLNRVEVHLAASGS